MSQSITVPYNWSPRYYQMPAWSYLENDGKRLVAVWHRRCGKDLMGLNWCSRESVRRVGLYWHLFPTYTQGKKVIWDGSTRDGRRFLDYFPQELVVAKNDTDMRITFANGSVYQVIGTDDPDRLVGANPVGIVLSEWSLMDPRAWDMLRPILNENGGWAIFLYTARGKNHGYTLYELAKKNPTWFSQLLTVDDTLREETDDSGKIVKDDDGKPKLVPVITKAMIDEDRAMGMEEALVQQEYYNSFNAPLTGSYYAKQMMAADEEKRIVNMPWESALPVLTTWDLGMDDATCIWFIQEYGHEIRLIDYYENSGEGLTHYAKILAEKPYAYDKNYAPHDIMVREMGTGRSRFETARSLGIRFTIVQKHEVADGIEAVRNMLPKCWFDVTKAARGVEALREYKKRYDPERKVFHDVPLHDWASHPADALRCYAWARRRRPKDERKNLRDRAISESDERQEPAFTL